MKTDAMSIAALAVAGVALWAFFGNKGPDLTVRTSGETRAIGADTAYTLATAQRRESGAAQGQNTAYLADWGGAFVYEADPEAGGYSAKTEAFYSVNPFAANDL